MGPDTDPSRLMKGGSVAANIEPVLKPATARSGCTRCRWTGANGEGDGHRPPDPDPPPGGTRCQPGPAREDRYLPLRSGGADERAEGAPADRNRSTARRGRGGRNPRPGCPPASGAVEGPHCGAGTVRTVGAMAGCGSQPEVIEIIGPSAYGGGLDGETRLANLGWGPTRMCPAAAVAGGDW